MKPFDHVFIIGEIGQNHNGSVDIAKLLVDLVVRPVHEDLFGLDLKPMDAIKLTKRDLSEELSASQMRKPYNSPNSFGRTYGEHRQFLELTDEEHFEVYKHAKSYNLKFVETICAKGALSLLKLFTPDFIKIASRDLTNLPLLEAIADTGLPVIMSTGMAGKKELDNAVSAISKKHDKISILHCVSEYPAQPKNVNLKTITWLIENYPDYKIGYSDHTVGISAPVAAVAMGATIIEKHITIDRNMKGTDQSGSLGPEGVFRMIRDIRLTELSLGKKEIFISEDVHDFKTKLERSIASRVSIKKGEIILPQNIHLLSPGDGFKWADKEKVIGKTALMDIPPNEIIYSHLIR
jgi:3-deoxy-D-glycero-D-galacto-nononate 9-phosphate synthase